MSNVHADKLEKSGAQKINSQQPFMVIVQLKFSKYFFVEILFVFPWDTEKIETEY